MGFIDSMRAQGHAVESVCAVLREQDCQVAARTYRAWRSQRPADSGTCWRASLPADGQSTQAQETELVLHIEPGDGGSPS